MPGVHAKLSASSASRWLRCTPSVRISETFEETSSSFAEEGTRAHEIAEKKLQKFIKRGRKKIECDDKDMDGYTDDYRDYVVEQFNSAKKSDPNAILLIEERLDFSRWVPEGFGTGDAVIIADGTCHIIDLKYGKGVEVNAEDNPQCRLYALGAIDTYDMLYDFDKVCMHIYQPRLRNISTEEELVVNLIQWGEEFVKPRAEMAMVGEGEVTPGEKQCQFCPARYQCRARAESLVTPYKENAELDPELLGTAELAELLSIVDGMKKFAEGIKEFCLDQMLNHDVQYEGYKIVEGRANRIIIDESGLCKELNEKNYSDEEIKRLKSLTELEKLVGKKEFAIVSAGYVEKPKGKPAIAPITDKRPVYQRLDVAEAFKDVEVTA